MAAEWTATPRFLVHVVFPPQRRRRRARFLRWTLTLGGGSGREAVAGASRAGRSLTRMEMAWSRSFR
jgi:hypothetical protein